MRTKSLTHWLLCTMVMAPDLTCAQQSAAVRPGVELRLRVVSSLPGKQSAVPAVVWLTPSHGTTLPPVDPKGHFTMLQKNRTFIPHLLVIPVGSVVQFPNADPFYHNVFSLYEGTRFDLGLYEAGSHKSVTFSREGVSYIFCNIHPEMSAVVIALSTPLYAVADATDSFIMHNIPPGNYRLHLWIEGVPQPFLDGLGRQVDVSSQDIDLGTFKAPIARPGVITHTNLYGKAYETNPHSPY